MQIFSSIPNLSSAKHKYIITIGTFDGVHMGHKVILDRLNKISSRQKGKSILITFFPHPRHVLHKEDQEMRLINTLDEKKELLEKAGLDILIINKFTKDFSRIKSVNFVRDILVDQLKVDTLVIGYDHHFGRNREGSINELEGLAELYGFNIEMVPPQLFQDIAVSSTKIRKLLESGKIERANHYLGYNFFINGKVVKGNGIGKKINFPTANILINNELKILPCDGVYAVLLSLGNKKYKGMMNIGLNPTLNGKIRSLEVNIFDFNQDIYGQEIKVSFIKRIRDEKRFKDIEGLKRQLIIDKKKIKNILE